MHLFIYGTLKKGFANHDTVMKGTEYLGAGVSLNRFPLLIAGQWNSPVLMEEPGSGFQVQGELYRVAEEKLAEIDQFEGTDSPHGYYRKAISVIPNYPIDGGCVGILAYTYFKQPSGLMHVTAGPLRLFPPDNQYIPRSQRNTFPK